ncbi:MAG: MazG nucleotide pyrophosphohydrolase domain-containing protein, partial [Candidatus Acidiferrales bacterium]
RAAHSQAEGQGERSHLDGVGKNLPSLVEAYQLTRKAAQVGFDWERLENVLAKLDEEAGELRQALSTKDQEQIEDEVGDLLFVATNIARFLGFDPEVALRRTNRKFVERFQEIERELTRQGKRLEDASLAELDALWERSKLKG